MTSLYNEIDRFPAAWLRNLVAAGHIAPGDVDERSIAELQPADVAGYRQAHFFAGIGVWSYALRLAGWPDDREVWTGSCPCPSFSAAGKGRGFADPRHLWPAWFRLIRECRPGVVFGEQVEGAVKHWWLDLVCRDLEGEGYAVGAAVLGAHSVGAPHLRQRLYFVAHREREGREGHERSGDAELHRGSEPLRPVGAGGAVGELGHADRAGYALRGRIAGDDGATAEPTGGKAAIQAGAARGVADAERGTAERRRLALGGAPGGDQGARGERERVRDDARDGEQSGPVADASGRSSERDARGVSPAEAQRSGEGFEHGNLPLGHSDGRATDNPWADLVWLPCRDGNARPTQSGVFEMADGVADSLGYLRDGDTATLSPLIGQTPNRVGRLRGYGNAINAQTAAAFVRAYLDCAGT